MFYAVGACEGVAFATHDEMLKALASFGLPTQKHWVCDGIEEVLDVYRSEVVCNYDEARDLRRQLPYEIDGIVLKVNRLADAQRIPSKTRAPGHAIVHKPIPWITPAETLLRDITVQVGRTGVLTPVAELEPVFVQGSTVSRATLHNEDEIRRKDIRIGDSVVIEKAGEVIPAVVRVVLEKRPPGATPFDFSAHLGGRCPACGGPIRRDGEFAVWLCENINCPAQKTRRLEYFAKRGALDLDGLGGIVADALVERGIVADPLDVFDLKIEQLATLNLGTDDEPRVFGEKNARKLLDAIERAKTLPLARWLHALAIPEVGEETAHDLAKSHANLDAVANSALLADVLALHGFGEQASAANPRARLHAGKSEPEKLALREQHAHLLGLAIAAGERLIAAGFAAPAKKKDATPADAVTVVGPVAAKAVQQWFASEVGRGVLSRMETLGISPRGRGAAADSPFVGKTFVLTGTLERMSRNEAAEKIRALGGNVSSSVSRKTDYVVAGPGAGSKLDDARTFGVRVLDEAEFLAMLGAGSAGKKGGDLFANS